MTEMEKLTNALLLIAGATNMKDDRTGFDQISNQMETANSDRSYDSERLSVAILTAGRGIAEALSQIAHAIENKD